MRKVFLLAWSMAGSVFFAVLMMFLNTGLPAAGQTVTSVYRNPESADDIPYVQALMSADITFPVAVEGTDLLIHNISSYEGPFLEDLSDREVVDVAALLVENTGNVMVRSAVIHLKRGELQLEFQGSCIPPGEKMLILESSGDRCPYKNFTACEGFQVLSGDQWLREGQIQMTRHGIDEICMTNLSGETLKNLRLYYKMYLQDAQIYVGGVTYQLPLKTLPAGASITVSAYRFLWDYSKIIGIAMEV